MKWLFGVLLGVSAWAAVACDRPDAQAKAAPKAEPKRVVDSATSREEALRRFRTKLAPVEALEGGKGSRDSLVAAYVKALGSRDTTALAAMAISPAEFGYLYYP